MYFKSIYMYVFGSFEIDVSKRCQSSPIHCRTTQVMKSTEVFIKLKIDKENAVYMHNGIVYGL